MIISWHGSGVFVMEVSLFHWCRGKEKKKLNDLNNSGHSTENWDSLSE